MKKKFMLKVVSAVIAAAQMLSCTAFASVISQTGTDSSMSYWYEDFNDGIATMKKSSANATTEAATSDSGAVKVTTSASGKMGYIVVGTFDFSKPVVISYDYTPQNNTAAYTTLNNNSGSLAAYMTRFENGRIKGYTSPSSNVGSTTTYSVGTTYKVQNSVSYNAETATITVKPYINGKQLIANSDGSTPIEYTAQITADMTQSMTIRFNFGSGGSGIIDNVMVRQEGEINLPTGAWISSEKAGVTYTDSAKYLDAEGTEVSLSYIKSINNLTAASQYELKKYDIENDIFLFNGTDAVSTVAWSGATGITVSGLTQEDSNDVFVLKLKDKTDITNFAGISTDNIYCVLQNCGAAKLSDVRESTILDKDGNALALEAGKLPQDTAKINFILASNSELTASDITFTGENVNVTATENDGTYTLDLSGVTLEGATEYTIAVGDKSIAYTTTGELSKISADIERFDSADAIESMHTSDSTNVVLTYDNGKLKYDNLLAADASTKYASYTFENPFDFSKGSMYLSYDLTLNQAVKWISTGSYLFNPQIHLGSSLAGYMPSIEAYGIRARNSGGGRVTTTNALDTMAEGDSCKVGILITYYEDDAKIGYTQFVNGERLYNKTTGEIIPEYLVEATAETISGVPSVRFAGRNLADGGIYIDNLAITTVDGITSDSIINMTNSTASIAIKNTVEFDEGTDAELTAPLYINTLTKEDISVTKYNPADVLLAQGSIVNDFTFDKTSLTIGNIDTAYVYVIKLNDANKLTSLSGKAVDTVYFKAGTNASGLVKTTVLDASGNELYADSACKWSANAAKIVFMFEKGYVTDGVTVGDYTAIADTNGNYVIDLSSAPLLANTTYTVKVNGADYGTFTTKDGEVTVTNLSITDSGFAKATITNTTSAEQIVYVINGTFTTSEELVNVIYEKVPVKSGETLDYTAITKPETTGATAQKVFVWDGFENMIPYCDTVGKNL